MPTSAPIAGNWNADVTLRRALQWIGGVLAGMVVLAALFFLVFGWNWLRGPIERMAIQKTGRTLVIQGDLSVQFGWPWPHIRARAVTFANPPWAREKQMLNADSVDVTIDLPQLLRRNIVIPEVRLEHPTLFLETGTEGRKSWLLDRNQQDENARVRIDRLTLDRGTLGYDDAAQKTSIRSELSTTGDGVEFNAQGQYQGLALKARGNGGPVLALRDENTPYPLKVDATVGNTGVRADGTITSLLKFSAMDMRLALRGDSLDALFPLIGIALPETHAYATEGHLLHSGSIWRYEQFSGHVGASDLAGALQVDTAGKRPMLSAELSSKLLDLADLAPIIGSRPGSVAQAVAAAQAPVRAPAAATQGRALPDLPFKTDRLKSLDAEVKLSASTIRRAKELPLENLVVHVSLRDSVLKLDPFDFGLAGGHLNSVITLDARQNPIQAHALVRARKLRIAKLFPTVQLNQTSIGEVNGEFDLAGKGNSVGAMLATSNGKAGLVVAGGEVSRLMMEKAGLHIWEILQLNLTGDQLIKLRCAVADFDVKNGRMQVAALVFDTQITTIVGTGSVDLADEKLDLTLNQKTKNTSPLALRSPIYVRGSFAKPVVEVDKGRVAVRAIGAVVLGIVNPFLALLPLIDAGPGKDSDCRQLVRDARAVPRPGNTRTGVRK